MNNYYPQQQGVGYANVRQPAFNQPLTLEKIRKMKQGGAKPFSVEVTEQERDIAICTHKDPDKNNEFSLIQNADGTSTCYICGKTFNLVDYSREEVQNITDNMLDVLQSIKTYFLDIPERVSTEYMIMIMLLERLPQLWEMALNDFNKYDVGLHNQMYGQNAFSILNNIMNPAVSMGYPQGAPQGYPQGYPQYPQGYPQGYPQNNYMGNPQGYPQGYPQNYNPFGYNAPPAQNQYGQQQAQQGQQQNNQNVGGNQSQGNNQSQNPTNIQSNKIFNT